MILKKQKYYKVLTKDLKAPNNTRFSYKHWRIKSFKTKGSLKMCNSGLHLYKSLKNISTGNFGERVFEAIPVGEYISDKYKICCQGVRLIKELKAGEVKDSEWAYNYCRDVKDIPEVYKNITESGWVCWYCHNVKDRPEIYKRITDSAWACWYCSNIKDRPEVYKHITDPKWVYNYCHYVKNRPEVCKNITNYKHI